MGIYVYIVRRKYTNIIINGVKEKVYHLEYLYKPSHSYAGEEYNKSYEKIVKRNRTNWLKYDVPKYVVLSNDGYVKEGAEIRKWDIPVYSCYDTPDFSGTHYGYAYKDNKNKLHCLSFGTGRENTYYGEFDNDHWYRTWMNGTKMDLKPSLMVSYHSPAGFSWGYTGSGCHQLALAILLNETSPWEAVGLYGRFTNEVISKLGNKWAITSSDIKKWMERK